MKLAVKRQPLLRILRLPAVLRQHHAERPVQCRHLPLPSTGRSSGLTDNSARDYSLRITILGDSVLGMGQLGGISQATVLIGACQSAGVDMSHLTQVFVFLLIVAVCGCATRADNISASYVSPLEYSHLSCEQIRQEIVRVNRRVAEVSGVQNRRARQDSVTMGVGLVLFWPSLFFLARGDRKDELARLKGEYEALERAAIEKNCDFAGEMGIQEVAEET